MAHCASQPHEEKAGAATEVRRRGDVHVEAAEGSMKGWPYMIEPGGAKQCIVE
jgi:hypothetical protein